MRIKMKIISSVVSGLLVLCGCAQTGSTLPDTQKVEYMANQALQTCGKGNVKSVSTETFTCKVSVGIPR